MALHLEAMACQEYELGVYPAGEGPKYNLTLDANGIAGKLPWLRARNANGYHVYIRPHGCVGLVLADDVKRPALARLHADGLRPAAIVETSPENYQCWMRVAAGPISEALATATAREIARRYGADPDAANWRQMGRLCGFTNRKPERRRADGQAPYVRFIVGNRGVAPAAGDLLEYVACRAREVWAGPNVAGAFRAPPGAPRCDLADEYRAMVIEHTGRFGHVDLHRLDWMICLALAARYPELGSADLAHAITLASPDLHQRHRGEERSYAERTARKAVESLRGRARHADVGASSAAHGTAGDGDGWSADDVAGGSP